MKAVLVFTALVALIHGKTVLGLDDIKTTPAYSRFVEGQRKVLELFKSVYQPNTSSEYYRVGMDYDIEANIEQYTNKKAVEDFLMLYSNGFLPKYNIFSMFYEEIREQAISLIKLFYYAKDFNTLYNTAAWASVHLNEGMFVYTFNVALVQNSNYSKFILPAPHELYPELLLPISQQELFYMYLIKQQKEPEFFAISQIFGIVEQNEDLIFYANYSNSLTYPNEEQKLAYLTEDVSFNSLYFTFLTMIPVRKNSPFRGEILYLFYRQMLARYYLERLSNFLQEIPDFSWENPIPTGYIPFLAYGKYPFAQRSNNYLANSENNYEKIRFLDNYEKAFLEFLQSGHFKAFNKTIEFDDPDAIEFVVNYWLTSADLFDEEFTKSYQRSYEITARRVLSAAPEPLNKYEFLPSALDFYQTSLRDPVSYQLYKRIINYIIQFKEYLKPYDFEELHYDGVKINDVEVDELVTNFDFYDYDAVNPFNFTKEDAKPRHYIFRQPRLDHRPFTVTFDITSEKATDAVIKVFIGSKYGSNGAQISLDKNWMNFFQLDWFTYDLVPGENKIERKSEEFFFFKEDSLPITEIWKLLGEGKLPENVDQDYYLMPERLMLPRGTAKGFPYQIFVFVYPRQTNQTKSNSQDKLQETKFKKIAEMLDNKPLDYPLDRPAMQQYFKEPNMFFKDVMVKHEGEIYPYKMVNTEWEKKQKKKV